MAVFKQLRVSVIFIYARIHFYRAMHFSAKRGIVIACACRLSVCL